MNNTDSLSLFAKFLKISIDNNPNFSEWEKWWRKTGVDYVKECVKQIYQDNNNPNKGGQF